MGPILGRELLRISLVHAVALAIWYLQTHTHTLADNFPFFLTFFRALFLKESPVFPVGGQGEQRKKGCAKKGGFPTGCRLE